MDFSSKLEGLFDEIHDKQKKRDMQLMGLVSELKPYMTDIGDATLLVPLIAKYMEAYIVFCEDQLFEIFQNPTEAKIADSILQLFKNRESLDIINKKALYIYIREMVPGINTPRITKVANRLKEIFNMNYDYYLDYGEIDFDY